MPEPSRGEIWTVNLAPTVGPERTGSRPAVLLSVDRFNHGPAGLVVVLPLTSKAKGIPFHVQVSPPEAGLKRPSLVKCEDVRSVSKERLGRRWGRVSAQTMAAIEDRVRILLGL